MASVIPKDVKKTVCFIFIKHPTKGIVPNGTGFIVAIKQADDLYFHYLVTAKHVLIDEQTKQYFNVVYVRFNKIDGPADLAEVPLTKLKIWVHPEPEVDIAVIPCLPDPKIYDYRSIPPDLIVTKEKFKEEDITEGDEVFFIGLFTPHFGRTRNYPVTRFGRVALISDEKVRWQTDQLQDLYLLETQSYGGNSGSPVFFYLSGDRNPGVLRLGPPKLFLAGIMTGTFRDAQKVEFIETQATPISFQNAGIAAVTPAYKLHEILFGPELTKVREQAVEQKRMQSSGKID